MPETKTPLDDLVHRIMGSLPKGVTDLQQDVENNLRAALQAGLKRMDLVTREEFEVQQQVLQRTRAKLDSIENQLSLLEAELAKQQDNKPT